MADMAPRHVQEFDQDTFMGAFVASLVLNQLSAIRPSEPGVRRGFSRVLDTLDQEIDRLRVGDDRKRLRQVVRLRNELKPSSSGSYEGFESALRALQLNFTSCPNPFYTEIAFTVPATYARATLDSLPEDGRRLAEIAAKEFAAEVGR